MKYTDSHEWIEVQGTAGKVGITLHAQKELGEVVHVELPQVGKRVKAGDEVAVLESTKAAVDIYSPVSGTILKINESLAHSTSPLNVSPEKNGWLFQIELENPQELNQLKDRAAYLEMIQS